MSTAHNRIHLNEPPEPADWGGRIGVIALATDLTIERDLRRMLPAGVEMFTNRIQYANPMTLQNLRAMRGDIARTAAGLMPGHGVDVAIYACTSGAAAIGEDVVREQIQTAHPDAKITNPLRAALSAFAALGVSRISVLTPYVSEINRDLERQFCAAEISCININGLGMDDDLEAANVAPATIARLAAEAYDSRAQALFISCTALRAAEVIGQIERDISVPVVSSNQALAWHALRLLQNSHAPTDFGALMQTL